MAKNLDFSNLEDLCVGIARDSISNDTHEIDCPHCNKVICVPIGKSVCEFCNNDVDLTINF